MNVCVNGVPGIAPSVPGIGSGSTVKPTGIKLVDCEG